MGREKGKNHQKQTNKQTIKHKKDKHKRLYKNSKQGNFGKMQNLRFLIYRIGITEVKELNTYILQKEMYVG